VADIAIDLGTVNTLIQVKGGGLVVNEPSVIAVRADNGRVVSVGAEAKQMIGRAPHGVIVVQPMRDGVIADVDRAELMLRHLMDRVFPRGILRVRPRVVVGVPSGITELERRAVRSAVLSAGAKEVHLISEPMAAAIGVGLPVAMPRASMVVNVGGGTTEIGVIALSGMVAGASLGVAGNEFDAAITAFLRNQHSLLIGATSAEVVKMQIGSAFELDEEREAEVSGRDLVNGIPRTVRISSAEIRRQLREPLSAITAAVRRALETTPPELAGDIVDSGFVLTGGGALLEGLDRLLAEDTGLPVHRDSEPLTCVARGAAQVIEHWAEYQDVLTR
jgi:rod shape-determining protein MreB and related proteins